MDIFNSVMLALSLAISIAAAVCMRRRPAEAAQVGAYSKNTYRLLLLLILAAAIALRVWVFKMKRMDENGNMSLGELQNAVYPSGGFFGKFAEQPLGQSADIRRLIAAHDKV